MPRTLSAAEQLKRLIAQLQQEKQEHLDAIAEIDKAFAELSSGTSTPATPKRGRPRRSDVTAIAPTKRTKGRRRGRGHYETTGTDSLLEFIRAAGPKGAATRDIVAHWKSEGRAGDGYPALALLGNAKKIRKEKMKNQRGSRYFIA